MHLDKCIVYKYYIIIFNLYVLFEIKLSIFHCVHFFSVLYFINLAEGRHIKLYFTSN